MPKCSWQLSGEMLVNCNSASQNIPCPAVRYFGRTTTFLSLFIGQIEKGVMHHSSSYCLVFNSWSSMTQPFKPYLKHYVQLNLNWLYRSRTIFPFFKKRKMTLTRTLVLRIIQSVWTLWAAASILSHECSGAVINCHINSGLVTIWTDTQEAGEQDFQEAMIRWRLL